ncbi:MAG: reverse transcriptase-like protein [Candidatus Lindowbacteria bacterium]|nr:reverse transcriptase-like protein [Candidatus Lindowbacteria bacterium]
MSVNHDSDQKRFSLSVGHYQAELLYAADDKTIDFYHLFSPYHFDKSDQYRDELLTAGFEFARETNRKINTSLSYVNENFLKNNIQYRDLVIGDEKFLFSDSLDSTTTRNISDQVFAVFIDGGARGNPGPAACAFVVKSENSVVHQAGQFLGHATNNEAEYKGLINALEWLLENSVEKANLYMDSQLVVKQVLGEWRVKSPNLIQISKNAKQLMGQAAFGLSSIPREENASPDELVNEVLDEMQHTL